MRITYNIESKGVTLLASYGSIRMLKIGTRLAVSELGFYQKPPTVTTSRARRHS